MKTIITCAITGAVTSKDQTPYLPITPKEIADSSLEAADAGASIVHLHVRNPVTGEPSVVLEYYQEVVERIRKENKEVLLNLTTGAGAIFSLTPGNLLQGSPKSFMLGAEKRTEHIKLLKPELCSLDFNTMHQFNGAIRINHKTIIKQMLKIILDSGTKPELEIFNSGDLVLAKEFINEGLIPEKPFWQFAMGIKYGWPANINTLVYAKNELSENSLWGSFGISKHQMPFVAASALLGGHTRVGLEDNIYIKKGILAKSNAELVKNAVTIINSIGGEIASYLDCRKILGIL